MMYKVVEFGEISWKWEETFKGTLEECKSFIEKRPAYARDEMCIYDEQDNEIDFDDIGIEVIYPDGWDL